MRSQSLILTCLLAVAALLAGLTVLVSAPTAQAECSCPGNVGIFQVVDGSGIAGSCFDAQVACQNDATAEARADCYSRDTFICRWGSITYSTCIPWEDNQYAVSCEQEYSCKECGIPL